VSKTGMKRSVVVAAVVAGALLAQTASAVPILIVSPSTIDLSPAQTLLTFEVDPNGTPLSALVLNLSALASGLEIVDITAIDVEIIDSGPVLVGGDYLASFGGTFGTDRISIITVGTVLLEGSVPGTPLVVTGNFTDSLFVDIPVGPTDVAVVIPEPGTLGLLSLGVLGLVTVRRRSA
jgi:hypothetical protein